LVLCISELRLGGICDGRLAAWYASIAEEELFLSTLVIGEIRPMPVINGLLAATAVTNGLILVTRNDQDIAGLGATVLNPF